MCICICICIYKGIPTLGGASKSQLPTHSHTHSNPRHSSTNHAERQWKCACNNNWMVKEMGQRQGRGQMVAVASAFQKENSRTNKHKSNSREVYAFVALFGVCWCVLSASSSSTSSVAPNKHLARKTAVDCCCCRCCCCLEVLQPGLRRM